ncbi:MAG: MFS transporter [Acidobacteriota bacterium]|nr:MFS transporter [Acidobacteriota bacterium]
MAETDTDPADQFDARIDPGKLDESKPGLLSRARRLPRNVLALSFVSFLNDASSEIIYPFLPLFLSVTLGLPPRVIGIIEGTAESVSSLLKLFAGHFSDRHGRRKSFVVFGYALASVTRPLLGFVATGPQALGIRVTDRIGKGIRSAPRDAMIADSASPAERGLAFGFHRAMDHAGAVVGPLLGYCILTLIATNRNAPTASDYRTLFLIASVPALAAVLVAAFVVREKKRRAPEVTMDAAPPAPPLRLSLSGFDGNFKRFLAVVALFTLSNSSDAFLLLRAREAGVSTATIPLLWAALHVSKVVSSFVGGDLSDRIGRKRLIVSGWLLYAAVYAGFAFVSTVGVAWALFLIYGIYFGLAEGAEKALVADLVAPTRRGAAYGMYNLAFGITVLPASLLMGALWDWRGATTAFLVSAAIGVVAALLLLTIDTRARVDEVADA